MWPFATISDISVAYNAVQFILDDLELLQGRTSISAIPRKAKRIGSLKEHLEFVRCFLDWVLETSIHHPTDSDLVKDIHKEVKKLLFAADSFAYRNIIQGNTTSSTPPLDFLKYDRKVATLAQKIKDIEQEIGTNEDQQFPTENSSSWRGSFIAEEKTMVGFNDEATELLDRLTGGQKQLQVISITGMAGIGKTTLAKRLYNDPLAIWHFHVRAWTSVSHEYKKRNLLHNILSSTINDKDPVFNMSEERIGEKLYKSLKGKRYFIVIDDIWGTRVWDDLQMYFPNDDNCSRILITSRIKDVALRIRPDIAPHCLRFLTQDESWELLKCKAFDAESCPKELMEIGLRIVGKCEGLPLSIVVVAGLLAKEKTEEWWRHIADNMGFISNNSNRVMDILELSYKHLPSSLKSCFLYLGTFPKENDISVKVLIWSWIAEGFIQKTGEKRLEDVAEDNLMDLISRNLVIVVKNRSDGGIKSCRIHDLLRDLCMWKARKKKFLQPICECHKGPSIQYYAPDMPYYERLPHCQRYFHFYNAPYVSVHEIFTVKVWSLYKFLRTLELRKIIYGIFPQQIFQLLHLRYLAVSVDCIRDVLPSVCTLWNLETCIIEGEKGGRVALPDEIWKMTKLRHLQISKELFFKSNWPLPDIREATPTTILENLQTISLLCPSGSINMSLARIPNLRKLGFHLTLSESAERFCFPDLAKLSLLEALKFEYQTFGMSSVTIQHPQKFPPSLKKLTLIGSHVDWTEMSIIAMLPNLEVLKVKDNFFSGPWWETSEDGFCRLRFLKLSHVDLQQWISYSSHFPRLECLVLNGCLDLEEIPSEFGDILTLQTIKVYRSSHSAVESTKQIQESQKSMGNDDFKVFIYHHFEEY